MNDNLLIRPAAPSDLPGILAFQQAAIAAAGRQRILLPASLHAVPC